MPKTYTEKEREYIIDQLKEAATKCLTLYGVKKTTVDELVKRANIPKGTFYLFFKSKEVLLFAVINDLHNSIQSELLNEMSTLKEQLSAEKLVNMFFKYFKKVDDTFLLQIMTNGDMELLMRKLPDPIVKEHLSHDDISIEQMLSFIPNMKNKNIKVFSGAFRALFMTLLYKREIGEDIYDSCLELMLKALVFQLMEE